MFYNVTIKEKIDATHYELAWGSGNLMDVGDTGCFYKTNFEGYVAFLWHTNSHTNFRSLFLHKYTQKSSVKIRRGTL